MRSAGEAALGDGGKRLPFEDLCLDGDRRLLGGDYVRALRLAEPVRARAREAWRGHDHDCAFSGQHLELAALGSAGLVDVPGEYELGAGCRELLEHSAAAR